MFVTVSEIDMEIDLHVDLLRVTHTATTLPPLGVHGVLSIRIHTVLATARRETVVTVNAER